MQRPRVVLMALVGIVLTAMADGRWDIALAALLIGAAVGAPWATGALAARLAPAARARAWTQPGLARVLAWILVRNSCESRRFVGRLLLAHALTAEGEEQKAAECISLCLSRAAKWEECPWWLINGAVDAFVSAGRYEEAIRLEDAWSTEARECGRAKDPFSYALVRINQAEALHNLGRDDEALARIDDVARLPALDRFPRNAALCLKAWILAHKGASDALPLLARVDIESLGTLYKAEAHFTRAVALRTLHRFDEAEQEIQRGLDAARRPSSRRNGWFLAGQIALDKRDFDRGLANFDRGIRMKYQGQGGPALLTRAHVLRKLGRDEEMQQALRLVTERDPQSFAARQARMELASESMPSQV